MMGRKEIQILFSLYSMFIYVYIIYSELDLRGTYMNDWNHGALNDSTLKGRTQNNEELTHPGLCSQYHGLAGKDMTCI